MTIDRISALALAGLMTLGVVAAMAQESFTPPATPEEAVTMRKDIMRENGQQLRTAGNLAGAEAVATMQTLYDNYAHLPVLFPEGSTMGDSKALPAVWERWDEFVAIANATRDHAATGLEAAKAGDTAGYTAALQAIGASCNQCHQVFRR